ncbi:MAG: hypothetical protein P4L71_16695 [Acetobacteraceae bacterium]|nr:hypothetical protein [Acetobacteraceae bacterium]
MRRWTFPIWLVLAVPAEMAAASGPGRPAEERIGTWVLTCAPAPAPCMLRHATALVRSVAGIDASLDIERRGNAFVPVVTLRGLKPAAMVAAIAMPMVSLRFDDGAWIPLTCDAGEAMLACAPDGSEAETAADALPVARSMTLQLRSGVPGVALPPLSRTLALAGTSDALGRLRARGAVGEDASSSPGLDWRDMLDRVLRAVGFAHGTADLPPWAAQLMRNRV